MSDQRAMHAKMTGGNVQCISMAHRFSVSRNTDHKWNPSSIDSKHKNSRHFRGQSFHPISLPSVQFARSHILPFPRQPDHKVDKTILLMSRVRQGTDYRTLKHLLHKLARSTWECIYHRASHILRKKPTNTLWSVLTAPVITFNHFLLSMLKRTGQGRKLIVAFHSVTIQFISWRSWTCCCAEPMTEHSFH